MFLRGQKKIALLVIVFLVAVLSGCGSASNEVQEEVQDGAQKEPTQEELNAQLKRDAVPADFIEINIDKVAKDTKLSAKGEVTFIEKDGPLGKFTLTTTEGDGHGVYSISNYSLTEVSKGDYVEIWGAYDGKDDLGMPSVLATIVEKTERAKATDGKTDFQKEAEKNAKQFPADSVATFEGARFTGMKYYYTGTIVGTVEIENNVGVPESWLVESARGYLMPVQFGHYSAKAGDEVEIWGTLSGKMYSLESIGREGIIDKVGSIHAMFVTVNGERQY